MGAYIFTSDRLGFRRWQESDHTSLAAMNADPEVMEFFPARQGEQETRAFIRRMQKLFMEKGYCYFAVEKRENREFIGFIGLAIQDFEADFTPCTDIGWRLKKSTWNKGYATEGAKACLSYAFDHFGLEKVFAIAPLVNVKSELVMKKIGMEKVKIFDHPKLLEDKRLKKCVLYVKSKQHTAPSQTEG